MVTAFSEAQNGLDMKQADGSAQLFPKDALRLLPTAACVCDAQGRIVDCNDKAIGLWGRAPAPGDTWETVSGDSSQQTRNFQLLLEAGRPQANAALVVRIAPEVGSLILANSEPLWDGDERVGSIVTFQQSPGSASGRAVLWETLDVLPAAIYTTDAEGRITFFNKAAADLWGATPEIGASLWCGSWKLYRPDGSLLPLDQCPMAVAIRERRPVRDVEAILERPDGSRVAILPHPTPLYDPSGAFVGAINMLVDITHQKVADERHILFARELNHRVKNALATVYAIAMQTLRYTDSLDSFRESFSSRLLALSGAHDLLVRCQWQETPLKTIIAEALSSFGPGRLDVEGDEAEFGPRATLTLAMTFHELVTNATRFGALANADGRISIRWQVSTDSEGERKVSLSWREAGGPVVDAAAQTGFGSRLINHNLMALGGSFHAEFARDGLRCVMVFPVINEAPGWPPAKPSISSTVRPSGATADPASPGGQVL